MGAFAFHRLEKNNAPSSARNGLNRVNSQPARGRRVVSDRLARITTKRNQRPSARELQHGPRVAEFRSHDHRVTRSLQRHQQRGPRAVDARASPTETCRSVAARAASSLKPLRAYSVPVGEICALCLTFKRDGEPQSTRKGCERTPKQEEGSAAPGRQPPRLCCRYHPPGADSPGYGRTAGTAAKEDDSPRGRSHHNGSSKTSRRL